MQRIFDLIFLPLRFILSHTILRKIGLNSLKDERIKAVLPYCRGKVLDIGCGEGNDLIRRYIAEYNGIGFGIDVYPWKNVDIICDTAQLPFPDESFDTVTIVATLNHIVEREKVLRECHRVLKNNGLLLITMLNPIVGFVRHNVTFWWDKDQICRGMSENEIYGIWEKEIRRLLTLTGFNVKEKRKFLCGLNNLYIGQKTKQYG